MADRNPKPSLAFLLHPDEANTVAALRQMTEWRAQKCRMVIALMLRDSNEERALRLAPVQLVTDDVKDAMRAEAHRQIAIIESESQSARRPRPRRRRLPPLRLVKG